MSSKKSKVVKRLTDIRDRLERHRQKTQEQYISMLLTHQADRITDQQIKEFAGYQHDLVGKVRYLNHLIEKIKAL